jgi:hypothetical protein
LDTFQQSLYAFETNCAEHVNDGGFLASLYQQWGSIKGFHDESSGMSIAAQEGVIEHSDKRHGAHTLVLG